MALEILTKEDLNNFKSELFAELNMLLSEKKVIESRKYFKTWEMMAAFNISKGKLQAMRNSGKLPFTRIGKNIYFEYDDIIKVLDENKIQHQAVGQGKNRFSIKH